MPNESAGAFPRPLPADLAADFERFRGALEMIAPDEAAAAATTPELNQIVSAPGRVEAWREYGRLLHARAAELALIGRNDRNELFTRHVLDCLNPLSLFQDPPDSVLDVGSGAGLPGIPLAIAWPETRVVLLESRERKAGFLEQAVRSLALSNARVVCARLEDYGRAWRDDPVAVVFVRALGDLGGVLASASMATRPGGRWVYFLGSRSGSDALPEKSGIPAEEVQGAFGGRLLTGRFTKSAPAHPLN